MHTNPPQSGSLPQLILYMPEYSSVKWIECSPPSWMVQLALEEKQLPYQAVHLSFAKGEHKSPEMLARNPRGTIPVLTDGELAISDTAAMFEYLEYAYPEIPMMPSDRTSHMRAIVRLHEANHLKTAGMALFAYLMRTPQAQWDIPHLNELKQDYAEELGYWETYAQSHQWLTGETLTFADLVVFAYIATSEHLGQHLAPQYPRLAAFSEAMKARPSVQKTWPALWNEKTYSFLSPAS